MEKIINDTCRIFIDDSYDKFQSCLNEINNLNSIKDLNEKYDAYLIICDRNTYNYQLNHFMKCIDVNYIYDYIINPGEESKSLVEYEKIMNYCKKINLSRKSLIIAIGGGVVGDIAGFVASTYMRGIDIVQVPTSLLAQVDSSIGGKTGINLGNSKNIIGSFHQPQMTYININALKTLPDQEYFGGMGEVIKYAFIKRGDFLDYLIDNYEDILERKNSVMINVIKRCAEIKSNIVDNDEKEGDIRKILNFGHTFGHGIERVCKISHGDAVSIGMNMAFKMSLSKGYISQDYYDKFLYLCNKFNLPISYTYEDNNKIYNIMKNDKKNSFSKINIILPIGEGMVNVFNDIDENLIKDVIKSCNNG